MPDDEIIDSRLEKIEVQADLDNLESSLENCKEVITNEKDFELEMIERLKAVKCSVEYALLVASGLNNERGVRRYQRKIRRIIKDFLVWLSENEREKEDAYTGVIGNDIKLARALFDYLKDRKPYRYKNDVYLLTDVIDNQLDKKKTIQWGRQLHRTYFIVLCFRRKAWIKINCS